MSRFTISQLGNKGSSYTILDSDLLLGSIGSATYDLSSVRVSMKEYADYMTSTYAQNNVLAVTGSLSAQVGLSANGGGIHPIRLEDLPTTSSGLQTGEVYTQTVAQIHGSGSSTVKVLCVA